MSNFWSGEKVLVTGGAGLIGSHIVEELVRKKAVVTVADNLKRGNVDNLWAVKDRIQFLRIDLTDQNVCNEACRGKDIVLHLASDAYGLSYSYTHHSEILTNNILLNTNVLNACHLNGVKRVLAVSSSCVYRDDSPVPTGESEGFIGEPEKGNLGYGWSKRMLEIQSGLLQRDYGMEIAIVRPANVYGPRDPIEGKGTHVIPALIHKILFQEGPIMVWGSGNQARDFIHVRDTARAMLFITEKYACAKPVNIGSMRATTIKELVGQILKHSGNVKEVIFDTTKPEGAKNKSVDISLLEKIGFKPEVELDDGLIETVGFYRSQME